jgi:hypothetical protein
MNSDALHTYEVHLVFPSTMTIDQVIAGIEEMLPYADYQVVELGEGDPNE